MSTLCVCGECHRRNKTVQTAIKIGFTSFTSFAFGAIFFSGNFFCSPSLFLSLSHYLGALVHKIYFELYDQVSYILLWHLKAICFTGCLVIASMVCRWWSLISFVCVVHTLAFFLSSAVVVCVHFFLLNRKKKRKKKRLPSSLIRYIIVNLFKSVFLHSSVIIVAVSSRFTFSLFFFLFSPVFLVHCKGEKEEEEEIIDTENCLFPFHFAVWIFLRLTHLIIDNRELGNYSPSALSKLNIGRFSEDRKKKPAWFTLTP